MDNSQQTSESPQSATPQPDNHNKHNKAGWAAVICGILLIFVGYKCPAGAMLVMVEILLSIISFALKGFNGPALFGLLMIPIATLIRMTGF